MVQYLHFYQGLLVKPLLVAYDLECHVLVGLVIQRPDDLTEGTLADHLEDLVPVRDVVVEDLDVGAVLVVVTAVLAGHFVGVDLARLQAEVPNLAVLKNFAPLKAVQTGTVVLENLGRRQG